MLELLPFLWVVAEPLSEFCRRRQFLGPTIYSCPIFADAAWPQSVNKDAAPVIV